MAIVKVTATLAENTTNLSSSSAGNYEGQLNVPTDLSGGQNVVVTAINDNGQDTTKTSRIYVINEHTVGWTTPKTDWKPTDKFNFVDFNRITANLEWLYDKCSELESVPEFIDTIEKIFEYTRYWNVEDFNAWETNLQNISKKMYVTINIGQPMTFYENGKFIDWNELNRIESACLMMKQLLDNHEKSLQRIPFRLGQFRKTLR